MTITHHPDPATLMSFAAGTLGEALSAVVASHADWCTSCRRELSRLETVGGAIVGEAEPSPVSDHALDAVLARLGADEPPGPVRRRPPQSSPDTPAPLARIIGGPVSDVDWRWLSPGVETAKLPVSKDGAGDLRLFRIAAGQAMPEHGHGGSELTLVLTGAYRDKLGRFGPGDIADVDGDIEHQPVVEEGAACICLVASERKVRFKGIVERLLQPLIGI
jgi:putative transcriptional regulator